MKRWMVRLKAAALPPLLARLEAVGFYKYADPALIAVAKAEAVATGDLYGAATLRLYLADSEDLAEGMVLDFLRSIQPFLARQGVTISAMDEDFTDHGYTVRVNGVTYEMYSEDEMALDQLGERNLWYLATMRAFGIVNRLLADARSDERVYMLYGGNDGFAVFLTSEMHRLIQASRLIADREKPVFLA